MLRAVGLDADLRRIWVSSGLLTAYSPFHIPFQALWAGQGPRVCWGQLCTSSQGPGTTS